MANGSVFPGGVHTLENNQKGALPFGIEAVLEVIEILQQLFGFWFGSLFIFEWTCVFRVKVVPMVISRQVMKMFHALLNRIGRENESEVLPRSAEKERRDLCRRSFLKRERYLLTGVLVAAVDFAFGTL